MIGKFVWYELLTSDTEAAERFYGKIIGWSARDAGVAGISYRIFQAGGADVAGMMELPQDVADQGGRPGWIGYVATDDVDQMAAKAARQGGAILRAPEDIPGIGRFAVIGDPQGAILALFKPNQEIKGKPSASDGGTGHIGWHELLTTDNDAGFKFYADLFGWTKDHDFDMGEFGVYRLFMAGDAAIGGMMNKPPHMPRPFWNYYFNVQDINVAASRVKEAGGQVLNGPLEVPGGGWIVNGLDPQGAVFALLQPKG